MNTNVKNKNFATEENRELRLGTRHLAIGIRGGNETTLGVFFGPDMLCRKALNRKLQPSENLLYFAYYAISGFPPSRE